jgi:hypothetical protein
MPALFAGIYGARNVLFHPKSKVKTRYVGHPPTYLNTNLTDCMTGYCLPTPTAWYPYMGDLYGGDGLHPSTQGHQHVRDAYEAAVVNGYNRELTYSTVSRYCTNYTSLGTTADLYVCPTITPSSKCYLQATGGTAPTAMPSIVSESYGSMTISYPTAGTTFIVNCTNN